MADMFFEEEGYSTSAGFPLYSFEGAIALHVIARSNDKTGMIKA
jgi:hypothetical protein